jgi:hypothetical protein
MVHDTVMLRAYPLRTTLLLPLAVVLISCGGDDDGQEVEGLITIEKPTAEPTYETYEETARVSGPRWTSVESVTWSNAAGGNGAANLTVQRNCVVLFFVFSECNHAWDASIPLAIGTNVITVTGHGWEGDYTRAAIAITRLACPPPPPATPFSQWPLACR